MPRNNITKLDPDRSRKGSQGNGFSVENAKYTVLLKKLKQFQGKVKPFQTAKLPEEKDCTACLNYLQGLGRAIEEFRDYCHKKHASLMELLTDAYWDYYNRVISVSEPLRQITFHVEELKKCIVLYQNYYKLPGSIKRHSNVIDEITAIEKILYKLPARF